MTNRKRFNELAALLEQYRPFWSAEVIELYPRCFEVYPPAWIEDLLRLDNRQLYDLERLHDTSMLTDPGLAAYVRTFSEAAVIERKTIPPDQTLDHFAFVKVKPKKRHEIETLSCVISELYRSHALNGVVDFGGGVGYLAQTLAHYHQIPTLSIDSDAELQSSGVARQHKVKSARDAESAADVEYLHADCRDIGTESADAAPEQFSQDRIANRLFFGLHTCGDLAQHQLETAVRNHAPVVLNFGCCYYKMAKTELFLSDAARQDCGTVKLNAAALTLATRSPRPTQAAFESSKRVKSFRYLIHLYQYHELGTAKFMPLGSSHRNLYSQPFEVYAAEQLSRLGADPLLHSADRLRSFADDPGNQLLVRKMMAANIIRSLTARCLELVVLLDRAMYLEEQGYRAELAEYFDPLLSPRNIGILAARV